MLIPNHNPKRGEERLGLRVATTLHLSRPREVFDHQGRAISMLGEVKLEDKLVTAATPPVATNPFDQTLKL